MLYSENVIEEVRMRNDILDVISGYVKLQKKGSTYFGLCPFHSEKSPSFSVSASKQIYHCFGCNEGGNVITFIMKYENYSFPEAIKLLAERAGIELPEVEMSENEKRVIDIKHKLLEINNQAGKYFYYQLKSKDGKQAYEYVMSRGLNYEMVKKFGLGYANKYSDDLYRYLKNFGYKDEILKESGLVTIEEKGNYDKFFNRVIFPIMDANNKVIGFGGRVMGSGEPKYLNSPETKIFDKSRNLYGLNFARLSRKPNILICEGYLDVISLHQAGFTNSAATLGTALTDGHAMLLKRYTQEVLLTYDNDGAGIKATLRAIPILGNAGLTVRVIDMKPYKDPDEFIKVLGAEAFGERIEKAVNSFIYEISVLKDNYSMNDPQSKTAYYNAIAYKLLRFSGELERNNYMEAVSREFMIPLDSLRKLVNTLSLNHTERHVYEKQIVTAKRTHKKQDGVIQSQKLLLTWLAEEKELYHKISDVISEQDFIEPFYHKVALILFDQLRNAVPNPAKIIGHFENEEEHRLVAELFNTPLDEGMTFQQKEKALNELIYKIKKNRIDYLRNNINDLNQLQEMIKEQADLQKMHISL